MIKVFRLVNKKRIVNKNKVFVFNYPQHGHHFEVGTVFVLPSIFELFQVIIVS